MSIIDSVSSYLIQATNRSGVEWLRRHVAHHGISVHSLIFKDVTNCHADATYIPLSEFGLEHFINYAHDLMTWHHPYKAEERINTEELDQIRLF